jgi:enoyl-CoA hydratase/carnithine racemase
LSGPPEEVRFESRGHTARITINRPDKRNSISPSVVRGIADGIRSAEADEAIRAIVLTGAGEKAFCAGGDLGGMGSESKVEQHEVRAEVGDLFEQMRHSPLPVLARVNGHALAGGFGLMLACDLVVGVEGAEIGTPEIGLGLWPFMITAVIQRDIPRKVALDLMLSGRRVSIEEGVKWGFVNRVVPPSDLDRAVDELVEGIAGKSPLITSLGKRSFYRAEDLAFSEALQYLAGMLTVCLESEDTIEGVTAWLQKRAPEWKGR